MSLIQRKPLSKWTHSQLIWTTQFADLRLPTSMGNTADKRRATLLRELKFLSLFQSRSVIKDTDLVNNPELQKLLATNELNIQAAIRYGALIFNIRDTCETFSEVNEWIKDKRAFPERLKLSRRYLPLIDQFLKESGVVVAVDELQPMADSFRALLDRVARVPLLTGNSQECLQLAIDYASKASEGGPLRFGDIYDFLVRQQAFDPFDEVIQWCKVAHCLVVPLRACLPVSSATSDLPPDKVAYLANAPDASSPVEGQFISLLPKKILPAAELDRLDFLKIRQLRQHGVDVGYFDSIHKAQESLGTKEFERSYTDYLMRLSEFLVAIGSDAKVELVDWQKAIAQKHVDIETKKSHALYWAVPVLLDSATLIFSQIVFGVPILSLFTGTAVASKHIRAMRKARHPTGIERLLKGSAALPLSKTTEKR